MLYQPSYGGEVEHCSGPDAYAPAMEPERARRSDILQGSVTGLVTRSVDKVTLEVMTALNVAGVRSLLLKGPAISRWLYDGDEERGYGDTDLLVSPASLDRASDTLKERGFELALDERWREGFAAPHALVWKRSSDRAEVDLHWCLPGLGLHPQDAWHILSSRCKTIELRGGESVEALCPSHRTLHLALHSLHAGADELKPHADLERGLQRLRLDTWRAAANAASELDALEPFSVALAQVPAGKSVASELGLPTVSSAKWHLMAQSPPRGALRIQALGEAPHDPGSLGATETRRLSFAV